MGGTSRAVVLRDAAQRAAPQDDGLLKMRASLRRADLAEELGDLAAELLALRLQRLGRPLDVVGGSGRSVGISLHARDVFGNVLGALGPRIACCG